MGPRTCGGGIDCRYFGCVMESEHSSRQVLTTGEVAKLCNVAPRTVSKWFDSGRLRGYRIPGSKDRRIPLDQLVAFMRAHGLPLNGLETGARRVIMLDDDRAFTQAVERALSETGRYEVSLADSAFEAGALVQELRPHVLIVDVGRSDVVPRDMRRYLRAAPELRDLIVIGMGRGLSGHDGQALLQVGFDGFLSKPFELQRLIQLVETLRQETVSGGVG